MLGAMGEKPLQLDRSEMVAVGRGYRSERPETAHDRVVVGDIAGAESEFEHNGCTYCYAGLSDEGCEGRGNRGFRKPREGACVDQVRRGGQLLRASPGSVGRVEVKSIWFAEQCYEFESTLRVDDLQH